MWMVWFTWQEAMKLNRRGLPAGLHEQTALWGWWQWRVSKKTSWFYHADTQYLDLLSSREIRMRPTCTGPDPRSTLLPGSFCTPLLSTHQLNLWVWLFNVSTLGARSQMFQPQLPEISYHISLISYLTSLMSSNHLGDITDVCWHNKPPPHIEYWSTVTLKVFSLP